MMRFLYRMKNFFHGMIKTLLRFRSFHGVVKDRANVCRRKLVYRAFTLLDRLAAAELIKYR